jgi:hypothetical protein
MLHRRVVVERQRNKFREHGLMLGGAPQGDRLGDVDIVHDDRLGAFAWPEIVKPNENCREMSEEI